jgi:hypothetical protein
MRTRLPALYTEQETAMHTTYDPDVTVHAARVTSPGVSL